MRNCTLFLLLSFCLSLQALGQEKGSGLPNPKLTPGRAATVTATDLCKPENRGSERGIPIELKSQVFDRYRINGSEIGYNVDRLIPAGLGGSSSIDNLWPQSLSGEWSWHRKNRLERRLRKLVCGGQLDLKRAQQEMATDWIGAYKRYIGEP